MTREPQPAELLTKDLREVVETVWTATLRLDVLGPEGSIPPPPEETWCSSIRVTGAWGGVVTVSVSESLARRAAGAMFDAPPEGLSTDDVRDALGEIANMTGGCVKALLPGPSHLSLPSVVAGAGRVRCSPSDRLLNEVAFQCVGSQIRVQVIETGSVTREQER